MPILDKKPSEHWLTRITRRVRAPGLLRKGLLFFWVLLWILGGLLAVELLSRRVFGIWHRELSHRHLQPYLMNGGYARTGDMDKDVFMGFGAPETYGYYPDGGVYVFDFDEDVSSIADRGDFLFQDRQVLADDSSAAEIMRVFVIGGSAAYGIGASSKDKRWYMVLERALSVGLEREVRLIPAAMIGYVSTQERLVLDWMVLPRQPDAVVIFDGFNDAVLPSVFGVRPGDPYDQGVLYQIFYAPLFNVIRWLAEHSHFCRALLHRSVERAVSENEQRILQNPNRLRRYARSTASVYLDNVRHMLARCEDEGVPCMVFLQPVRDVTRRHKGQKEGLDLFAVRSYEQIHQGLEELPARRPIYDLTSVFDEVEEEEVYIDNVHFTDLGHELVAIAMYYIVLKALRDH